MQHVRQELRAIRQIGLSALNRYSGKELSRYGIGTDVRICRYCKGIISFRNDAPFCRSCDRSIHDLLGRENRKWRH
jgi:hypothetical protein